MMRRRRGLRRFGAVIAIAALAVVTPAAGIESDTAQAQTEPGAARDAVGWDTYRNIDGFSQLRGQERSRQFSSFADDGSNNDGFQGTYSCLRQSELGCVIAEREGAGEVSSIWLTREPWGDVTGTGDITIELDGRTVLDAPLVDVVSGKVGAPFVWPLVGNAEDAAGGVVIKVPMPYRESMRITTEENPYFYHVNYRTFPNADGVRTFDPADPATDVVNKLRRFGVADPKATADNAATTREDFTLPPGARTEIATVDGPAQINQLRLRLPQVVPSPRVVDDGRAFGAAGGSSFRMAVAPENEGIRIVRRFDPQVADQVASLSVDGVPAGEWRSGAAQSGGWGVQAIEVDPALTQGKSSVQIDNRFVSSSLDVNEFRYDVQSKVNGEWVRTDVLDLGPAHPGEEQAHGYRIDNPVFAREKLVGRYKFSEEEVAASKTLLDTLRVRITFDGKTTVDSPVGEFFGSGLGEHDVRTLMSSIDPGQDGWYTAWWPMPFSENAKVELVNTGAVPLEAGTGEVTTAATDIDTDTGYFHTTSRRGLTTPGEDWNFMNAEGAGTFYGVTHTMRGLIPPNSTRESTELQPLSSDDPVSNQRNYLEGDERFFVDGSSSPAWYGTGSEDYYESGWYFRAGTTFSMPLAGNPAHEINGDGCQYDCTGAYRLQVPDAVPFSDGMVAGIEHGPANDEPGDYSSTAYWYGGNPASHAVTDEVDLADPADREAHQYTAAGENLEELTSRFEGDQNNSPFTRTTTTATGPVSFTVGIDGDNEGVRLRRLSDQIAAYQQADVFVDGAPAGSWMQPLANGTDRWLEDHFDVPAELTQGKEQVTVEIIPRGDAPAWSASRYTVFSR